MRKIMNLFSKLIFLLFMVVCGLSFVDTTHFDASDVFVDELPSSAAPFEHSSASHVFEKIQKFKFRKFHISNLEKLKQLTSVE